MFMFDIIIMKSPLTHVLLPNDEARYREFDVGFFYQRRDRARALFSCTVVSGLCSSFTMALHESGRVGALSSQIILSVGFTSSETQSKLLHVVAVPEVNF